MIKPSAMLVAGAFALASTFALADDRTSSGVTSAEQAKMKQDADAKKAEWAKMTPEQKQAATKARRAKARSYEDHIEMQTQNPMTRNMGISKSYATTKNDPQAPRGTLNEPETEQKLMKNKGQ